MHTSDWPSIRAMTSSAGTGGSQLCSNIKIVIIAHGSLFDPIIRVVVRNDGLLQD